LAFQLDLECNIFSENLKPAMMLLSIITPKLNSFIKSAIGRGAIKVNGNQRGKRENVEGLLVISAVN